MDELFFALFDQHAEQEFAWLSGKLDKLADDGSIEQFFALLAEVTQEDADWFLISAEFTLYSLRNPEAAAVLRDHNERHRGGIARLIEYFLARSGRQTDRDLGEMARVFIAIRDGALAQSHAEPDLTLPDGRALHAYDTGGDGLPVFWHHGTPNIGAPPRPLFAEGIRWVSFYRPGYGGSTAVPERDVASVAECAAAVADAFGIERFAVMGHSGGGPHALACGALLHERVLGVVSISGLAPFDAEGLDWYAGMNASGADGLRAAVEGRAAKEKFEAADAYDSEMFTEADHAALAAGTSELIDDDLAFVGPWGFDPAEVTAPVLIVHGEDDRVVPHSHSAWLAKRCPAAEFRSSPGDGHVSVLRRSAEARDWLTRL